MPSVIGQDTTASGFDPGLADPPITFGVWGDSGNGDGVVGSSSHPAPETGPATGPGGAGVFGLNNAVGGVGVWGQANQETGIAVMGTSAQGTGVSGRSEGTLPGVAGTSTNGPGVSGTSPKGPGISGTSADGFGVTASSTSGTALHARRQDTSGAVIEAHLATPTLAGDFSGNVKMSGTLAIGASGDSSPSLRARPGGGLELRVSRPGDQIDLRRDGGAFAALSIAAEQVVIRRDDGTPTLAFDTASGNLGICAGTTPRTALHLPDRGLQIGTSATAADNFHWAADTVGGPRGLRLYRGDHGAGSHVLTVRSDTGRVGVGTTSPRNSVGIRGTGISEELLSFEDSAGVTKWHVNQKFQGRSGLNFVETGVADGRLYLGAGGKVGVGTTTPAFELDVNGISCAKQFVNPSDVRLKCDITPVSDVLTRLAAVQAVSFRSVADQDRSAPRQLGVLAQDVEPGFPELVVNMGPEDLKAVDYSGLVGVLVEAVNELSARNTELSERLATIEQVHSKLGISGTSR